MFLTFIFGTEDVQKGLEKSISKWYNNGATDGRLASRPKGGGARDLLYVLRIHHVSLGFGQYRYSMSQEPLL